MVEPTCQNCTSPEPAVAQAGTFLICKNAPRSNNKWQIVAPKATCKNFAPSAESRQNTRLIPLTQDKIALVDPADYPALVRYKWCAARNGRVFYAITRINKQNIFMHRMIINPPNEMVIDHIDHNGLNNRRSNLRICTKEQNTRNRKPNTSRNGKYKGVHFDKTRNKFKATIKCQEKSLSIGYYKKETEAAKAYDKKAKKLFKEFAYLNFPEKK